MTTFNNVVLFVVVLFVLSVGSVVPASAQAPPFAVTGTCDGRAHAYTLSLPSTPTGMVGIGITATFYNATSGAVRVRTGNDTALLTFAVPLDADGNLRLALGQTTVNGYRHSLTVRCGGYGAYVVVAAAGSEAVIY